VTDKDTGKPIGGATVIVRRSISDPKFFPNRIIEKTHHLTATDGKYAFRIPPEQAAEPTLYIEVDAEHPDYAPQAFGGYALTMIRKNEKLGAHPFFERLALRRGEPITGRITTPDGQPGAGVKVLARSRISPLPQNSFELVSFADTRTDAEGHFRVVVTTPAQALFWILPEKFAPAVHSLQSKKRGDLGTFVLKQGVSLRGKVFDSKGTPLPGLYVNFRRERAKSAADYLMSQLNVSDAISRTAMSGPNGDFQVNPLPPGDYSVQPDEYAQESLNDRIGLPLRPLPAVFFPRKLTLKEGETPEPLMIQAVPHVVIEAQCYDSKGMPSSGQGFSIKAWKSDNEWNGLGNPDASGKIVVLSPRGFDARLGLYTNEHSVLRHRLSKDIPLRDESIVELETLDQNIIGFEITRYVAPVVIVNVTTEDGQEPKNIRAEAILPMGEREFRGKVIPPGMIGVHRILSRQQDGWFRSSQIFADEDNTINVLAAGFEPKSEKVKLPEGATKELTFTSKTKKPETKVKCLCYRLTVVSASTFENSAIPPLVTSVSRTTTDRRLFDPAKCLNPASLVPGTPY